MIAFDASRTNFGRIRFLQYVSVILFLILGITVFYRQCIEFFTYTQLGKRQCLRRILYPGLRGTIYDRNGKVLATHRDVYYLYVDLNFFRKSFEAFCRKNKDIDAQQEQLWALVHDALLPYAKQVGYIPFIVSRKKLLQHYRQNVLLPLTIAQDLQQDIYARLLTCLPPTGAFQVGLERVRYYPYGRSACHVMGYVRKTSDLNGNSIPGNDLRTFFLPREKGCTGIEEFYDEHLKGYNGGDIWRVTPSGQKQKRLISIPSIHGEDLKLSLDIDLQRTCEQAMENLKGSVSILDIASGGVLAMVSKPDFDLNDLLPFFSQKTFQIINCQGAWLNRALQGLYPPGSIFKLVSFSALLRAGLLHEDSHYTCNGVYRIGNRSIKCHNHNGHGSIATQQAIQFSCNPFIIKYGLQLKPQALHHEACFYHLNVPSGIDLPFETKKMWVPSPQWKRQRFHDGWTLGDTANMLIGQGYLLVTPLKMACFAASLAKNQTNFIPHLVQTQPQYFSQALPEESHRILIQGMQKVGEHYVPSIPTAIKTGTAQVKVAGERRYTHIGWMIGFAPINQPKIAFCIQIEQNGTENGFWGGQVCAPIAREFLHAYFNKE